MAQINSIDYKKYKRFFSFGCSMTDYLWPTWADIIGQHIPEYYNFGKSGGGNLYISSQISEANQRFNFTKDDLIIVMWTSVNREDRYINGSWVTHGNIYSNYLNQNFYDINYIEKYVDYRGFLIRDLGLISLTFNFLNKLESDFCMLNMAPIVKTINFGPFNKFKSFYEMKDSVSDVIKLYNPIISNIKPDILTLVFNGKWPNFKLKYTDWEGKSGEYYEIHPLPIHHLKYLQETFKNFLINEKTKQLVIEYTENVIDTKEVNWGYDLENDPKMFWKKLSKSYESL